MNAPEAAASVIPASDPPPRQVLAAGRWVAEVHAALERMIADQGRLSPDFRPDAPPVATFDWDNTCIRGDIGETVLAALDEADGGDRMARYDAVCAEQGTRAGYAWAASALAGWSELDLRAFAQATIESGITRGILVERPEIRELIWSLQRHGWDVWIVSASVFPAVHAFAQRYGIPAGRVIGVHLAVGPDGRFLPELASPLTFREGKVESIDRHIGRRPTFACGDARTDQELLESARFQLLIDKGDAVLRQHGEASGWWIQPAW